MKKILLAFVALLLFPDGYATTWQPLSIGKDLRLISPKSFSGGDIASVALTFAKIYGDSHVQISQFSAKFRNALWVVHNLLHPRFSWSDILYDHQQISLPATLSHFVLETSDTGVTWFLFDRKTIEPTEHGFRLSGFLLFFDEGDTVQQAVGWLDIDLKNRNMTYTSTANHAESILNDFIEQNSFEIEHLEDKVSRLLNQETPDDTFDPSASASMLVEESLNQLTTYQRGIVNKILNYTTSFQQEWKETFVANMRFPIIHLTGLAYWYLPTLFTPGDHDRIKKVLSSDGLTIDQSFRVSVAILVALVLNRKAKRVFINSRYLRLDYIILKEVGLMHLKKKFFERSGSAEKLYI